VGNAHRGLSTVAGVQCPLAEVSPMPTVMRIGRFRFFFYSNEGNEPRHIHVEAGEDEAKFWLLPVTVATNHGFRPRELNDIEQLVVQHEAQFVEAWDEYFGGG
jgi:hypothetical protein